MNGKQCKGLRRMARALTIGVPWTLHTWKRVASKRRRIATQLTLRPECGRALCKRFKDGYRRLARKEAAALQLLMRMRGE